jgi:rod shape-determining protein MreB
LAAVGAGAILTDSDPVFCLDIGGGVTNVAVVSADGIIAGLSMNVGGNNMDANVVRQVAQTNLLRIGALTAERIKNEIGSLSLASRGSCVAEGSSVAYSRPAALSVQSADVYDCIRVYVDKILEYATVVLNKLPAEVAAAVNKNGIYLSGGVAKISGLPEYISKKLEMRTQVCEEPQFAVISGAGEVARDKKLKMRISEE